LIASNSRAEAEGGGGEPALRDIAAKSLDRPLLSQPCLRHNLLTGFTVLLFVTGTLGIALAALTPVAGLRQRLRWSEKGHHLERIDRRAGGRQMAHMTRNHVIGVVLITSALVLAFWAFVHRPVTDYMDALSRGDGAWTLKSDFYYCCMFIASLIGLVGGLRLRADKKKPAQ